MTSAEAASPQRRDPFSLPDVSSMTVGVLGGTGEQGRGLARRWAAAGINIVIGSRNAERAEQVAGDIGFECQGADNALCAAQSDVVLAAIPWSGHAELLAALRAELAGKVLIDCVNPMGFDKRGAYSLRVDEGSAAEQAAGLLPDTRVVAAFHHVSAVKLLDPNIATIDCDVLVAGDDREATDTVQALAGRIPGMRGIYAGRLRNAGQLEALTANLISINRRYRAHASLRVTDVTGT